MNAHLTARHMPLTPEVRQFCDKRIKALNKKMAPGTEVDIILSAEKRRHKAEIHAVGRGTNIVLIEESNEILSALNLAFAGLERKLQKEKEKLRERKRRGGRERKAVLPAEEPPEPRRRVIPGNDYSPKPMSVEEAILQLDLKKRDVFLFRKPGTERWALVYRRRDGHYGLVEPE
ncbi:MAG TPA: ribosome-associated translation inhibitor RaiA [Acidobacteriota bacterium]